MTTLYLQLRDQRVLSSLLEDAEITEAKGPKKKKTVKKSKKKASRKKTAKKTTGKGPP